MKKGILAAIPVLATSAMAFLKLSAAKQLRQRLAQNEARLAKLETENARIERKFAPNVAEQEPFKEKIVDSRDTIQSSTARLDTLFSSPQEAREIMQDNVTKSQTSRAETQ